MKNNFPQDFEHHQAHHAHHRHPPFPPPPMNTWMFFHRYVASVIKTVVICATVCFCVKAISDNKHSGVK